MARDEKSDDEGDTSTNGKKRKPDDKDDGKKEDDKSGKDDAILWNWKKAASHRLNLGLGPAFHLLCSAAP